MPLEDYKTTRAEHLAWCKQRALEYLDTGDLNNAFASFISDMNKHAETREHMNNPGVVMLRDQVFRAMTTGRITPDQMRRFINGFS